MAYYHYYTTKTSTPSEKFFASVIDTSIVLLFFIPFYFLPLSVLEKKLMLGSLFLLYNFIMLFLHHDRSFGMILLGLYWKKNYSFKQHFLYVFLYTASFLTLLFWVFIPLDLFIVNVVLIQLPFVWETGTTLHGYLAGQITTVKRVYKQ